MPRVIHFEIHAENPERAIGFYRGLFDWRFQTWPGGPEYWVITTGPDGQPGINGGLLRRKGVLQGDGVIAYVCTVDVASLDDTVGKALAAGGSVALARQPVPGIGWLAYLKDTEGNLFGVMQSDPSAK